MKNIKNDLAVAQQENTESLILAVSKFFGKPVEEVKSDLSATLTLLDTVLPEKKQEIKELEILINIKEALDTEQKTNEEEQKFLTIEKEVLASLDPKESKRMTAMRSWLQEEEDGERYETSYKQAIMKIHKGEVFIKPDSVQFLYAHKELDRQELKLPDGDGISNSTYDGFADEKIQRREIKQKVLDKNHPSYRIVQDALQNAEKEGKYFATEENTFIPILNGFEGKLDQQTKAMQFLTGFVGWAIISPKKDENDFCRILACRSDRHSTDIFSNDGPNCENYGGALLLSKDC